MGCDITAHVEIKVNGEWYHWNHPKIDRWYDLFARMAGVRGDAEPISLPRGVPDDASFTTKLHRQHDEGDAHSDSWLTAEEVASLQGWIRSRPYTANNVSVESQVGYIFGNGWDFKKYGYEGCPEGFEDARLVFWFDN